MVFLCRGGAMYKFLESVIITVEQVAATIVFQQGRIIIYSSERRTAIITPSPSETAQGIGNHGDANVLVSWCPSLIISSSSSSWEIDLTWLSIYPSGGGGHFVLVVWGLDAQNFMWMPRDGFWC